MLKPGGALIFSVPYSLEADTLEHFPSLHEFEVYEEDGRWVLLNRTREGLLERFESLVFHGGAGQTLEMRVFSLAAIRRHAAESGFSKIDVLDAPVWRFGSYDPDPWSRPMILSKAVVSR